MDGFEFRPMTILHTKNDTEWCEYILRWVPQEKLHLRIETLVVDELVYENPPEIQVAVVESHVVLLLTSSYLVDFMEKTAEWLAPMLKKGDQDVTTVVMAKLCLTDEDVTGLSDKYKYDIDKWEMKDIDTSGRNIQTFIGELLDIFDENRDKRRIQRKSIKKRPTQLVNGGTVEMIPTSVQGPGEKVTLLFEEEIEGKVTVKFKNIKPEIPTEKVNPFCVTFECPATPQDTLHLQVNVDGRKISRLKLTNKIAAAFTSLEMLCQIHGMDSTNDLDQLLAEKFNQSMCHDGSALKIFEEVVERDRGNLQKNTQYPTLLHWAAGNGLHELSSALLSGPGAEMACNIDNCDEMNPEDLARHNGHLELADCIAQFIEMKKMADQCDLYVQSCKQEHQDVYEIMTSSTPGAMHFKAGPPVPPRTRTGNHSNEPDVIYSDATLFIEPGAVGSRSQTELIEIQEEVKKGNFTMKEAEMLFTAWKERNQTGSAVSFRARQQNLCTLRDEYSKTVKTLQSAYRNKKKKMNQRERPEEEENLGAMSISEPYLTRNPTAKGVLPQAGRHSNTSVSSGTSWHSSDSGRASAISHTSISSDDFEQEEAVIQRGSSSSSLGRDEKAESRKSTKDLYLEAIGDFTEAMTLNPPAVPPQQKTVPSAYSRKPPPLPKKSSWQ